MFLKSGQHLVRFILSFILFAAGCLFIVSCNKDSFITSRDALIGVNVDSLKFDTVFTSVGSVTQTFKVSNLNNQQLRFSTIKLMGGNASFFKININGQPTSEVNNLELAANDSLYVFVTVTINPNNSSNPFIVSDSIAISYNGNTRFVQLQAYGQNAHFIQNAIIKKDVLWSNDLPYVILGGLQVDTGVTLSIAPGCNIYTHANAPILIDGTLRAVGSKPQPVIFTGDRLDVDYKDLPSSWPGIYLRGTSVDNVLQFVIIKNAYRGLVSEGSSGNSNPKLILQQCIVDNAYDAGLLFINSNVDINNSLISNCGNNISVVLGGDYHLTNCTVAAYPSWVDHKNPVLTLDNSGQLNGATVTAPLNASFINCIFWGAETNLVPDEIVINKQGADPFNVVFSNSLYKAVNDPVNSLVTDCIKNMNPLFDSIDLTNRVFNFHTSSSAAPGIDKGINTSFSKDLDDKPRNNGLPDIGCYERQ